LKLNVNGHRYEGENLVLEVVVSRCLVRVAFFED